MTKEKAIEQIKRWLLLCVGLATVALGVAFSIKGGLGTSPISSLPYVLSAFTPMSVGVATILLNVTLVLLQILLLRKKYDPIQLIQLPIALAFGTLTDFSVWLLGGLSPSSYFMQVVFCGIGILLVGIGVSLEVTANVATLAGEGMVLAICRVFPVKFSNAKVGVDGTLVLLACIFSLVLGGRIVGVREGTVAAAILVGLIARQVNKPMQRFAQQHLETVV